MLAFGHEGPGTALATDGGEVSAHARPHDGENLARLDAFRTVRRGWRVVSSPVESVVARPELLLALTVPLAVGYVALRLPASLDGGFSPEVFDDVLVHATLFVLGTYAVAYGVSRRRLERLEDGLPDLLERLASLNEAGVSIVSSFDRVRGSEMGELNDEVEYLWRDIQWGSTVEGALERFQRRVETPAVTRVVTLITNAMRASNEIGPVLRIAAEQARADRQLRAQRRQTMLTYLVVIYVSFLVFVVVVAAIDLVLIPSLPETPASGVGGVGTSLLQVSRAGSESYRLVFFHAALIQATLSGLVGGQMGEGSVKDGVKHATIMLGITYVLFLLFDGISLGL
jgi:flagellar protein FlaJ